MRQLRAWLMRLAGLFNKKQHDQEMAEELESHLQMHIEENLSRGMTPQEARRQALIKLGGAEQAKERYRERRSFPALESFVQDLRYGLRQLRRSPGFTAVAVLTLALGIGVNTSIFSLVYSLALRPLPVKDAGSIVNIYEDFRGRYSRGVQGSPEFSSYPEYVNYRDGSHVFAGLAAYAGASLSMGGGMWNRFRDCSPRATTLACWAAICGSDVDSHGKTAVHRAKVR